MEFVKDVGKLVFYKDINPEQIMFLVAILSKEPNNEALKVLESVIDNPPITLELLDLLAGIRIKFPDRERVEKLISYIFIYDYVKNHDFSEDSYLIMSKQYQKRITHIKKIVQRMDESYKSLM